MKVTLFYLLLQFLWLLNSCFFFQKDPIVLQINDQTWTSKQFAKRLAQKIRSANIQNAQNQEIIENLKEHLIGDLAMEYLIYQWAKTYSISISEKELQQNLRKNTHLNNEVFNLYLQRKKINKREWENNVRKNLLSKKVMQQIGSKAQQPSLEEIKEYYTSNINLFKKKQRILIYHIFHEKKDFILKVKERLKQGETMEQAVYKFTDHPQMSQARWVEKGSLEVFDKAFQLKKNQISPIWSSAYAYHLIQVLDKKPAQILKFEKVKDQIRQKLLTQQQKALFTKWLDRQMKNLSVLKNEEALKKIKVRSL